MPLIEDLAPCNYFPVPSEGLLAVGWLSRGAAFAQGDVSPAFFEKLATLCLNPWQPIVSAGFHTCDLCQFEAPRFRSNVFVPYQGFVYVAPVAITHYIASHWYKPPKVFVRAVAECPPMNSLEYKKAILSNGGRALVKATAV
jgi:hypothetical protein